MNWIKLFLVWSFVGFGSIGFSQQSIDWKTLSDVSFESTYYKDLDEYLWFPAFGETVNELAGKEVSIEGYVIPVDLEEGLYVLSAYPYSACFFCGNAGPESVMSLKFKSEPKRYDLDEVATFKGRLRLNDSNVDELNYILEGCEQIK